MFVKFKAATLVAIAITIAVFWYLFSRISLSSVINSIQGLDRTAFALFLVCSFSMNIFRCWRYLLLLQVSGYRPNKLALFMVVLVRNFCSDLLPARIGTLSYVALVTSRLGVSLDAAISGWAYSFVFDILALAPLVVLVVTFFSLQGASAGVFLAAAIALAIICLGIIYALPYLLGIAHSTLSSVFKKRNSKYLELLLMHLEGVQNEMLRAKRDKIFVELFTLSLLVRIFKYAAMYMLLYALLRPWNYTFETLAPAKVVIGLISAEMAASLPISGIAGFGLYQGVWATVFGMLGFPQRHAQITSLSHHLITQAYAAGLALVAISVLMLMPKRKLAANVVQKGSTYSFLKKVSAILIAIVLVQLLTFQVLESKAQHTVQNAGEPATQSEQAARTKLASELGFSIVFDSNRSGTFGIYSMQLDSSEIKALADSPDQEIAPDPSPDGNNVVYARAVGLGRQAPSDIWLVNSDGTNARMLVQDGSDPTFSKDSKRVYFLRARSKVMEFDLSNSAVTQIFPRRSEQFKNAQIAMPRISQDGKLLAFTSDLPRRWHAWRVDLESEQASIIGNGCQPGWFLDTHDNIWATSKNARERTGFFHMRKNNQPVELVDYDAPWGHEYFASIVGPADKAHVLYAACGPKQHDQEHANYQLFIKSLVTGERTRITFDGFTNRWPKLLKLNLSKNAL